MVFQVKNIMADDDRLRPEDFGLIAVPIPVPPTLEEALGYPGEERYVAFHEWRPDNTGFYIDDGQGTWQGSVPGWSLFLRHPAVTCICERVGLDLHRSAPVISRQQYFSMAEADRGSFWRQSRCLVLDRNNRTLYIARPDNATIFVAASSVDPMFPDDDEDWDELPMALSEGHELPVPAVDSQPPIPV